MHAGLGKNTIIISYVPHQSRLHQYIQLFIFFPVLLMYFIFMSNAYIILSPAPLAGKSPPKILPLPLNHRLHHLHQRASLKYASSYYIPVLFKIKRRPCKMAFFLCIRILLSPDKMDCALWVPLTVYWHIQTIYYPPTPHISSLMRPGNSYRHKNPVPHFSYLPFTLQFNQQQFQTWD